jgi:hypothetical protein
MAGICLVLIGAVVAYQAWSVGEVARAAGSEGIEATAEIVGMSGAEGKRTVQLAWKGPQGSVHHFGPVPISDGFYATITKDGQLAVKQVAIRYREDEPAKRPVIVADNAPAGWMVTIGPVLGGVLLVVGFGFLASALRAAARP